MLTCEDVGDAVKEGPSDSQICLTRQVAAFGRFAGAVDRGPSGTVCSKSGWGGGSSDGGVRGQHDRHCDDAIFCHLKHEAAEEETAAGH